MEFVTLILMTILTLLIIIRFMYPPFWRDFLTIKMMISLIWKLKKAFKKRKLIIDRFEQHSLERPDKIFLYYEEEKYTYQQADRLATKVACAFMSLGVSHGDTVALIMCNEPSFLWVYLGAQKIGVRLSLINHYLLAEGLQRSIDACNPKMIIIGDGIDDYLPLRVREITSILKTEAPMYTYHPAKDGISLPCFSQLMQQVNDIHVDPSVRAEVKLTDPSIFIYTSGTTGFPKPAIITHKRSLLSSMSYGPAGFTSKEIMYLTMPLYHASAMNLAVLNVIQEGATLVLRDKFSATNFWKDCVRYKVTIVQYIGEMFRYLTNIPETQEEKEHQVWAIVGNGLRLDVWREVTKRFGIKNIYEFYGATELQGGVINFFNQEGSVGRLSPLMSLLSDQILVDIDEEIQQPYRDANGRCRRTKPGGSGLFLSRLTKKVTFEGYLGPASLTTRRIIKDVMQEGDFYFNTSDVFTMDEEYNLYFKDRLGDSYRWKGENVSTTEVSSVINTVAFVQDANVYGVSVPGCEGKAGMAAITLKAGQSLNDEKMDQLGQLCRDKLPLYARPRFLRFQRQMSLNSTFKHLKTDLVRDGFDVEAIKDEPVYFLDRSKDTYLLLDAAKQNEIMTGQVPL